MDLYTKIFLTNAFLIVICAYADKHIKFTLKLKGLMKITIIKVLDLWLLATILSAFPFIIYLIWS